MRLLWTKSTLPLSILIRAITGEDCSHFSIVFDSRDGGLMFESNLLGTHPKFFKNAEPHLTICHEINVACSVDQEDAAWDIMVDQFDGKGYDFKGALYLGYRKLLKRILNLPIPEHNAWQSNNEFFCSEVYRILELSGISRLSAPEHMESPHDVWIRLNQK